MSCYKSLDIYKISLDLFYITHPDSLLLPKLKTINHLEKIHHLYKDTIKSNQELIKSYDDLGGKIYNFIK